MKIERVKKKICIVPLILLIIFIWGNSLLPPSISNMLSDSVTSAVGGETQNNSKQEKAAAWLTSGHIRKLAHVIEFALLGIAAYRISWKKDKSLLTQMPPVLLFGLLAALIDETIQLHNDRTASIEDIWIDFAGFLIGCVLAYFVRLFIQRRTKKVLAQ